MASGADTTPPLCVRIRETRERLQEQWKSEHPGERGNPYTQERVAQRFPPPGLTTKSYGDFERHREPDMQRLREIAIALGLDEDYFLPTGDLASATARVEAEADQLHTLVSSLTTILEQLRALIPDEQPARAPAEPE